MSIPLGEKESFIEPGNPPPPEPDPAPPVTEESPVAQDIPIEEIFSPRPREETGEDEPDPVAASIPAAQTEEEKGEEARAASRLARMPEPSRDWREIVKDFCRECGKLLDLFFSAIRNRGGDEYYIKLGLYDYDGPKEVADWQRAPWEPQPAPGPREPTLSETFRNYAQPSTEPVAQDALSPTRQTFSAAAQGRTAPDAPEPVPAVPAIPLPQKVGAP